jgi:hypothetical protein
MIAASQLLGFVISWKFILLFHARYPKSIDKATFFHYT